MQKLQAVILAGCLGLTLPAMAQKLATPTGDAQLKTVAWQDQDDRKPQGDQDDQNRKDRDRDKNTRDRNDRDRARGDRGRGDRDNDRQYNRGDNDRDRSNGQYGDRGGYYGNGQYGNQDRDGDRGGYYGNGQYGRGYHNVLAPEWQQKFDSYYQRWLQYRATNNTSEMRSMEQRMQNIMANYRIPTNVPYDQVASPGIGGYQNRY
jgi:hypothetical protein